MNVNSEYPHDTRLIRPSTKTKRKTGKTKDTHKEKRTEHNRGFKAGAGLAKKAYV